jgi:hypothetical protein
MVSSTNLVWLQLCLQSYIGPFLELKPIFQWETLYIGKGKLQCSIERSITLVAVAHIYLSCIRFTKNNYYRIILLWYLSKKVMMWVMMQRCHSPMRAKPSIERLEFTSTSVTIIRNRYVFTKLFDLPKYHQMKSNNDRELLSPHIQRKSSFSGIITWSNNGCWAKYVKFAEQSGDHILSRNWENVIRSCLHSLQT